MKSTFPMIVKVVILLSKTICQREKNSILGK